MNIKNANFFKDPKLLITIAIAITNQASKQQHADNPRIRKLQVANIIQKP